MPQPSPADLPFAWRDEWPEPLPDCAVSLREAGITLGSFLLEDWEWQQLHSRPVFTLRVDEHDDSDSWTTQHPNGTRSVVKFRIPLRPVLVPRKALADNRAFEEWVHDTHGALGRLLVWDDSERWWMVSEPELELLLTCGPGGLFEEASDELSWLTFGADKGRREVAKLRARYDI